MVSVGTSLAGRSNSKSTKNSFLTPDFAYPATVAKNAQSALDNALKTGNDIDVIKAVIQLTSADNLIDRNNALSAARRIDSIASISSLPAAAILYSIEAQLYNQIYTSDSWRFNNRNLPVNSIPDNPDLWDKDMFGRQISSLVWKSLSPARLLLELPVESYSSLLDNESATSRKYYPTMYQVLMTRGVSYLRDFTKLPYVIPFRAEMEDAPQGERIAGRMKSYADTAVNYFMREKRMLPAAASVVVSSKLHSNEIPYLLEWADSCSGDEAEGILLNALLNTAYSDYIETERKFVERAGEYVRRFPNSAFTPTLESAIMSRIRPAVSMMIPTPQPVKDSVDVKVMLRNTPEMYMLVYPVGKMKTQRKLADVISGMKPVASIKVGACVSDTLVLKFKALPQGSYVCVPSRDESGNRLFDEYMEGSQFQGRFSIGNVVYVSTASPSGQNIVLVADGKEMSPLKGADVSLSSYRKNSEVLNITTDSSGIAEYVDLNHKFTKGKITYKGENIEFSPAFAYRYDSEQRQIKRLNLFTDRAIYRPNDTLRFVGVGYSADLKEGKMLPLEDCALSVDMRDANYKVVDSLKLTTDKSGRITGEFVVPAEGLLGRYSLTDRATGANVSFEVAEYKMPTFYVEVDSVNCGPLNENLEFAGRVVTYSGMPLSGANVRYDIECMRSYWRGPMAWCYDAGGAIYGSHAITDADGRFTISLPMSGLAGTPYEDALYQLKVAATSQAGETQSAPARRFFSGKTVQINVDIPNLVCLDSKKESRVYDVKVTDLLGKTVDEQVRYKLLDTQGAEVVSGIIDGNKFRLPADLTPGHYKVIFETYGRNNVGMVEEFTAYSPTSAVPPVETALWIADKKVKVPSNVSRVKAKALTSYPDAWMFCEVTDGTSVLQRKMQKAAGNMLEVDFDAPALGEQLFMTFYACHNMEVVSESIVYEREKPDNSLVVSKESFRDKVNAPSVEHWKFRFARKSDNQGVKTSAFATVTNAALDALVPFNWSFVPRVDIPRQRFSSNHSYQITSYSSGWLSHFDRKERRLPKVADIDTYRQKLYGGNLNNIKIRGTQYLASANVVLTGAVADEMKAMKTEESEEAADEAPAEGGSGELSDKSLRPAELPMALFAPLLKSDEEGTLEMEFDVPDFNTTWRLQLIGYDKGLQTTKIDEEILTSKPVMIQSSLPRFVRTGDRATFSATMFNTMEQSAKLSGRIAIYDMEGRRLLRDPYEVECDVPAKGNYVLTLPVDVNEIEGAFLVKVYASLGEYSDGEQSLVSILPSSQPVVEGMPIYMLSGEDKFIFVADAYPDGSKVAFNYCSNPAWTVLSSLVPLTSVRTASVLSKSDALFGHTLGVSLMQKSPTMKEAVRIMANSDELESPMLKKDLTRLVSVENTPWINSALSQKVNALQLSSLAADSASNHLANEMTELLALQNEDGGWSWCPGMSSSEFITMRILKNFGVMKRLGVLPQSNELTVAISSAVKYCDAQLEESYRMARKSFNPLAALPYLLVRGELKTTESDLIAGLRKSAVSAAAKEWKQMDIDDAAIAAMFLGRNNRKDVAKQILASLKERSIFTRDKGRRYENLSGKYPSLYVTMHVLNAFNEVSAGDKQTIDEFRQWLLLQRQTENWGNSGFIPELAFTLLTTGSDWTEASILPVIKIGGKEIAFDKISQLTGELTMELTGEEISGREISIEKRNASPSWGGISSVSVLPILEVKAGGTDELTVQKRECRVIVGSSGEKIEEGPIRKGDKIRVFLTVNAKRDFDYVVISDNRAACLEPVSQIASYTSTDGLWYYMEPRDVSVNLYIGNLSKGSYIVTYDCYATHTGEYASGIANIQSIYAPAFAGHSSGSEMKVLK